MTLTDPRGRPQAWPVVITIFTQSVLPDVLKLHNQAAIIAGWPSGSLVTPFLSNNLFLTKFRAFILGVILKSGSVLPADVVVIAMGPWSGKARHWFPKAGLLNVTGNRAHSIVMKISDDKVEDVTGTAMFCTYDNKDPEIYPRYMRISYMS